MRPIAVYTETRVGETNFRRRKKEETEFIAPELTDGNPTPVRPCCLFPEPGQFNEAGGPFYPPEDLPDNLRIISIAGGTQIISRNTTVPSSPFYPPDYYQRTYGEDGNYFLGPVDNYWQLTYNSSPDEGDPAGGYNVCLIGLYDGQGTDDKPTVEDLFPDTLTINGTDTITRTSAPHTPGDGKTRSCMWIGVKTGGGMWKLDYGMTTMYKFHLTAGNPSPTSDDKTPPQSSPIGTYGANTVT